MFLSFSFYSSHPVVHCAGKCLLWETFEDGPSEWEEGKQKPWIRRRRRRRGKEIWIADFGHTAPRPKVTWLKIWREVKIWRIFLQISWYFICGQFFPIHGLICLCTLNMQFLGRLKFTLSVYKQIHPLRLCLGNRARFSKGFEVY